MPTAAARLPMTASASAAVSYRTPEAHRCWVSMQIPIRSSWPASEMISASSSKLRPTVPPAPAVFSRYTSQSAPDAAAASSRASTILAAMRRVALLGVDPPMASGMEHETRRAESGGGPEVGDERYVGPLRGRRIGAYQVDQVGRVAHRGRYDPAHRSRLAVGSEDPVLVRRQPPLAAALGEQLQDLSTHLLAPAQRCEEAATLADLGSEAHTGISPYPDSRHPIGRRVVPSGCARARMLPGEVENVVL